MTNILICDNNPIFAEYLKKEVLTLLPEPCSVSVCHSPEELRLECNKDIPQIALLDIHLNETPENGITLAKELFPQGCGTSVIFITGYMEYVSDVYETDHIYFIRKPVDLKYLKQALEKAMHETPTTSPVFPIYVNGSMQLIDMRDVLCVESFYRKLRFRMWNEILECYGSFSKLPESVQSHMIHCHKSFLVNPDYIRTMDHQKFILKDGSSVPISRARNKDSRQTFLNYCARHLGV